MTRAARAVVALARCLDGAVVVHSGSRATAAPASGSFSIVPSQVDPGAVVVLTGTGYRPSANVKLEVCGNNGLDGTCTIKSVDETGNVDPGGSKEFKIVVDANVGGDDYEATAMQFLHEKSIEAYQPGGKFEIKADPEVKTRILLMGGIS